MICPPYVNEVTVLVPICKKVEQKGVALFTCKTVTISLTLEHAEGDRFLASTVSLWLSSGVARTSAVAKPITFRRKLFITAEYASQCLEESIECKGFGNLSDRPIAQDYSV